ncbi:hypothetical protein B0T22DRAFT_102139 [Podospora appendiculata]|uniref:Uncharacterized protein n=1 Tax=Podospora appendiculata TaxID=314037 RepID=A0AAE1CHY4_9PEZI|nr:hypothetical protein B0T22DRAFT_102139 [Podospora appendiculata]
MNGPTLTMASAVDASSTTRFQRSHSTPNFLAATIPARPATAVPDALPSTSSSVINSYAADRTNSLKSLPSIPAFDVPSFDLGLDFHTSFQTSFSFGDSTQTLLHTPPKAKVLGPKSKATTTATTTTATTSTTDTTDTTTSRTRASTKPHLPPPPPPDVTLVTQAETLSRTRSMINRHRSWLPSSKSSPDVRAALDQRPSRSAKDHVASAPNDLSKPKPLERPRTVESFADFAKRSWIPSSRSPSPPSKVGKLRSDDQANDPRHETSKPKVKAGPGNRKLAGSRSLANLDAHADHPAEPSSSTSRAFNRASVYLTRMKQKPQNVFSKSASSLSLTASSVKSSKPIDSESTAPSAAAATTATNSSSSSSPPSSDSTAAATKPESSSVRKNVSCNSLTAASLHRNSSHTASSLDTTTTAATSSENSSQSTADTGLTMPHPTSRDPLWSTFRMLDTDFAKFAAKNSTSARMGVVRSTLVPFLRSTAYHPSNSNLSILSPEDVDRRATILNKWWNGLLEMLDAGQSRLGSAFGTAMSHGTAGGYLPTMATNLQPVAGVDRPTLLESTTMIMMRPEWRACTSYHQPLAERSPDERVRARSGTQSTTDGDADSSAFNFLAQSAEHNVRTMFVSNLFTQMALVVDKMSMRHAPLSLVNWCGKACAYAFFFAPGISDVLVRLWILNGDLLRRVAEEFGLPRSSKGESDDIVALFPPHMGKLGWTSAKALGDRLRVAAKLPLIPAKIPWHGPWVSRWRGGDTDLFYIFCKYYYILAEEFMPAGLPLVEKARAPAFVLVHAQLLSTLDSTIHRQASIDAMLGPPISDALHGADAALTGISLPSNLLKGMDENRLIILLRDMLAEYPAGVSPGIKHVFAQAFMAVMKAATKRTSRYENASCFMLCDFLEEALVVFDVYQNMVNNSIATSPAVETTPGSDEFELGGASHPVDYIDWPFWFDVGRMIMDSNNTMSEIRIMSFIFAIWDAIVADPARKEALCLGWLLKEEVFEKFFNNWCPMVRAYYMRLLCWRVCRDSGGANELDVQIFLVVSQRLRTVWSHHLWLKHAAEAENRMPPSTAPCYPTPGKRFLIIRTEVQPAPPALLLGFDSFSGAFSGADAAGYRGSYSETVDSVAHSSKVDNSLTAYKKKWTLLGKVLSFSATQASAGSSSTGQKRTWDEELEQARRDTAASRTAAARSGHPTGPPPPPKQSSSSAVTPSSDSSSSTGSAPVFEASTFVFRFALTWQGQHGGTNHLRDRIVNRPRLPAPAQARVSTRSAGVKTGGSANGGSAFRSESPPPIAPGLPPETRRVSGLLHTGLVSEARNARPLSVVEAVPAKSENDKIMDKRLSLSIDVKPLRLADETPVEDQYYMQSAMQAAKQLRPDEQEFNRSRFVDQDSENGRAQISVRPARPVGIYASGAPYTGRALVEWSLVVGECNNFVDRRRDEGVMGLNEVEVPILGVEGLGIRQRA